MLQCLLQLGCWPVNWLVMNTDKYGVHNIHWNLYEIFSTQLFLTGGLPHPKKTYLLWACYQSLCWQVSKSYRKTIKLTLSLNPAWSFTTLRSHTVYTSHHRVFHTKDNQCVHALLKNNTEELFRKSIGFLAKIKGVMPYCNKYVGLRMIRNTA